jgi:hypothetical protein
MPDHELALFWEEIGVEEIVEGAKEHDHYLDQGACCFYNSRSTFAPFARANIPARGGAAGRPAELFYETQYTSRAQHLGLGSRGEGEGAGGGRGG